MLAQGNVLLCNYSVCIPIDFLPHHYPLWENVNNTWLTNCQMRICLLGSKWNSQVFDWDYPWHWTVLWRTILSTSIFSQCVCFIYVCSGHLSTTYHSGVIAQYYMTFAEINFYCSSAVQQLLPTPFPLLLFFFFFQQWQQRIPWVNVKRSKESNVFLCLYVVSLSFLTLFEPFTSWT